MNSEQRNISEVMQIVGDYSTDLLEYDHDDKSIVGQSIRHLEHSLDGLKLKFYECGDAMHLGNSFYSQIEHPNLDLHGENLFKFNLSPDMILRVHIGLSSNSYPLSKTRHYFFTVFSQTEKHNRFLSSGFLKDDFESRSLHYHYLGHPKSNHQKTSDLAIDLVHKFVAENARITSVN